MTRAFLSFAFIALLGASTTHAREIRCVSDGGDDVEIRKISIHLGDASPSAATIIRFRAHCIPGEDCDSVTGPTSVMSSVSGDSERFFWGDAREETSADGGFVRFTTELVKKNISLKKDAAWVVETRAAHYLSSDPDVEAGRTPVSDTSFELPISCEDDSDSLRAADPDAESRRCAADPWHCPRS